QPQPPDGSSALVDWSLDTTLHRVLSAMVQADALASRAVSPSPTPLATHLMMDPSTIVRLVTTPLRSLVLGLMLADKFFIRTAFWLEVRGQHYQYQCTRGVTHKRHFDMALTRYLLSLLPPAVAVACVACVYGVGMPSDAQAQAERERKRERERRLSREREAAAARLAEGSDDEDEGEGSEGSEGSEAGPALTSAMEREVEREVEARMVNAMAMLGDVPVDTAQGRALVTMVRTELARIARGNVRQRLAETQEAMAQMHMVRPEGEREDATHGANLIAAEAGHAGEGDEGGEEEGGEGDVDMDGGEASDAADAPTPPLLPVTAAESTESKDRWTSLVGGFLHTLLECAFPGPPLTDATATLRDFVVGRLAIDDTTVSAISEACPSDGLESPGVIEAVVSEVGEDLEGDGITFQARKYRLHPDSWVEYHPYSGYLVGFASKALQRYSAANKTTLPSMFDTTLDTADTAVQALCEPLTLSLAVSLLTDKEHCTTSTMFDVLTVLWVNASCGLSDAKASQIRDTFDVLEGVTSPHTLLSLSRRIKALVLARLPTPTTHTALSPLSECSTPGERAERGRSAQAKAMARMQAMMSKARGKFGQEMMGRQRPDGHSGLEEV
ncbi:hypothetical protein KIPB_001141, partial [Kipferlia bialata]